MWTRKRRVHQLHRVDLWPSEIQGRKTETPNILRRWQVETELNAVDSEQSLLNDEDGEDMPQEKGRRGQGTTSIYSR